MKKKLDSIRLSETKNTTRNSIRSALALGLSVPLLLAAPSAFAVLDLGPAANLAVFQMGTPTDTGSWLSSQVTINGNVDFRDTNPGGNAQTVENGNVEGSVTPSTFDARNWTVSGTYSQVPDSTLMAIANQARTFSMNAVTEGAALPNIGAIGDSTGSYTFTAANLAEPGTYIVSATSLALTGGANFTLDGSMLPAGSRVIVNVGTGFSLHDGGSILLAGGLTPGQVLINYTGTSIADVTGGSGIAGTFLGPNTTANFHSNLGVIDGSVIADEVNLGTKLTINGISFVPEPGTVVAASLLLIPLGVSMLRIKRKR